jgi:hypothetical protein
LLILLPFLWFYYENRATFYLYSCSFLQPAVEIISFRLAELRGLARWRSRFQNIGLDEKLIDGVTERVGMLVVQVERFSRVAATVVYLVHFPLSYIFVIIFPHLKMAILLTVFIRVVG